MAIENPIYINQFNLSWPDGLDPKSQGDDHIRNIKGAITRSFPNITGPMTATHTQLNAAAAPGAINTPGVVMMWPYSLASIPAGWKVCNGVGNISTGQAIPNLMDRFPVGAGASYVEGVIGGTAFHRHTAATTVNGTALNVTHLPPHTHGIPTGSNDTTGTVWNQVSPGNSGGSNSPAYNIQSQSAGSGAAHTHGASTTLADTYHLPPYYPVYFIIKD